MLSRTLFKAVTSTAILCFAAQATSAKPASQAVSAPVVEHHSVNVGGQNIFYREAGPKNAPALLLLHGFPASSFMYRNLIPQLSDKYRVIAPDMPGYGFSEMPARTAYTYSFDTISCTMTQFMETLGIGKYAIYVQDFGGPVGYRLAIAHPDRITAIISQNGSAYEEGLADPEWDGTKKAWANPTPENRAALKEALTYDYTRHQYVVGEPDPAAIPPETYTLDYALLQRPGNHQIQLDLLVDFGTELKYYPKYQAYFRKYQPPLLAVWGKNDPYFLPAAANAFKRDLPKAKVIFYDTGHFALETKAVEIGAEIHRFLDSLPAVQASRR